VKWNVTAALEVRQRQRLELRAAFSAYKEVERQWDAVRNLLLDPLRETEASPASGEDEMVTGSEAP
jgi:hypothetical protein